MRPAVVSRPITSVVVGDDTSQNYYYASSALFGKKSKRKGGGGGGGGGRGQQPPQEKQSVREARFDAATRQFMFTMVGLSKILPDKSKKILDNINLSFYPGAKIGVVGLNGSGKSTLLKIMAGVDTEFDGTARPLPGASIGYLPQEPELEYETVQECIDEAVKSSQAILDEYNDLSMKLADPDIGDDEMTSVMEKIEKLNDQIEAADLWELDRVVSRAMDALRVPDGDAKTSVLSGGEKRRVALCRLLLQNHDMLLLDEPTVSESWKCRREYLLRLQILSVITFIPNVLFSIPFSLESLGCREHCVVGAIFGSIQRNGCLYHARQILPQQCCRMDLGARPWCWHPS